MKRIVLSLIVVFAFANTTLAQTVTDTVSTGAGYANQVWYSLENDEQGSAPKNNWDIAFDVTGYGSSIHINSVTGTMLWKYPASDTSGWSVLDTTGMTSWTAVYNSDTSWSFGAFDKGMVTSNPFDLGWGVYNSVTHIVGGDSLYVIKLANGTYKKLWIESLNGGVYSFKYADINGANLQNASLAKSTYTGKNFAYYSLQTNAALDREPLSVDWDLVFTQYTSFIPGPYTVAGILHNYGVTAAHVEPVANPAAFTNWSGQTYSSLINTIGYDWKAYTGSWTIDDSLVYFVKTVAGDIWKIIPAGFGGSGNGNHIFTKEKLSTSAIRDESGAISATLSVYPNPSENGSATIIYDFKNESPVVLLNVYDVSGKIVYSENLNSTSGLQTHILNTSAFVSGMFFISLESDGKRIQQKLIVQ